MNRRQFIASLTALVGSAGLPFGAARAVVAGQAATATLPPTTYAWAHLIVRAQNRADPAMLSRQLGISRPVADQLIRQLAADGVIRAPGAAGIARAVAPLDSTARTTSASGSWRGQLGRAWDHLHRTQGKTPLVNTDGPELVCAQTADKDPADARPDKPVQEGPRRG